MVINQILNEIRRNVQIHYEFLMGFDPKRHIVVVKKGLPCQSLWCGLTVVNNDFHLNEITVCFLSRCCYEQLQTFFERCK